MSGNSTSLYATSSSNGTTTSNNFTTLYPNAQGVLVPTTPYGNANVVALLAAGTDGGNTITNISATGNIYAQNFFGNLVANLVVPGNTGEVIFNNAGQANASPNLTFSAIGNVLTVAGNISGNYILGNGSQLTGLPATYGNANVAAFLPVYGGNVNAAAVFGQGLPVQGYDFVQMQYSNAVALPVSPYDIGTGSWFYLDAGGATFQSNTTGTFTQIVLGNDSTITATGNISGNYFIGNGSQLTGLPVGYSNANVATFLADFGSNVVSTTGNITGGYFLGNGSQLTGLPATYGNANVVANLAALGSNPVSTTGNVSAGYFFGNGSQLTGIVSDYGNANVATFLASGTNTQDIITTGTVTGNLLTTAGASGNIIGVNYVSANFYLGNGSQLTGLPATYSNANVAAFLPTYTGNLTANNISSTGNINVGGSLNSDDITSSGNVTVFGDQIITGNLTVQGTTTTINSNTISTNDKNITVANNQSTSANIDGAGLDAGNPAIATWRYNAATQTWQANIGITPTSNAVFDLGTNSLRWNTVYANVANITGNVSANYYTGNGSLLTGVVATGVGTLASLSVTGTATVGNVLTGGQVSAAGNVTGAYIVGNGSLLTSIPAGNITGQVANAAVAGTVYTNAQPNITSVGTLTSLSVTGTTQSGNLFTAGAISATGNVTGAYIFGNGSQLTGLPATYGNANVSNFLANGFGSNSISTTGNITAGYFIGNGSALTSLTGSAVTGTVANATYATTAGSATTATTATTAGTVTANAQANITSVGVLTSLSVSGTTQSGNLFTAGAVSATGNVTGAYILGNGSQLTGLPATYGNANVSNFLANFGSNSISTSGNVTAGYFVGNGSLLTSINAANVSGTVANATYATSAGTAQYVTANAQANITSLGVLTSLSVSGNSVPGNLLTGGYISATGNIQGGNLRTVGLISATGNVTGNYFIGNGSQLTGIAASGGDSFNPFLLPGM